MELNYEKFSNIDVNEDFFNSLKNDYQEFSDWFNRKSTEGSSAFVFRDQSKLIIGFLYLKIEDGPLEDVSPELPPKKRVKIGTLKIVPHGTRMGERFIKKAIDFSLLNHTDEIYVTIFEHHDYLVKMFARYGFMQRGSKQSKNGKELVLIKNLGDKNENIRRQYPYINGDSRKFILALHPQWHSRLLPDSILNNEDPNEVIRDVSHTNSIHKIYLTNMRGTEQLRYGDTLLIYRTSDGKGPAHFRSVATSICVVEEVRNINEFPSQSDFLRYCSSYSIFSRDELLSFYKTKKYPIIIKFTYNAALEKRVNRAFMIESLKMDPSKYWGFFQLKETEFSGIVKKGGIHEGLIIN